MYEKNNLINVLKKIYRLLDKKQKFRFLIIIVIMLISAVLTQLTPKAIGWLTYGIDREVTQEEVEEAAKRAYILDYINGLPDKFNTPVSEGGNNLSGGQRQRIAIARIFLRKPKILILDEATSALDNTSEKHIQKEIEKMKEENNTTIIAIAHRLTTLKNCDKIIVLNKGHIEEEGKFDELIEKNGMFSDMYYGKLN